jgi:hypothetical protein
MEVTCSQYLSYGGCFPMNYYAHPSSNYECSIINWKNPIGMRILAIHNLLTLASSQSISITGIIFSRLSHACVAEVNLFPALD